MTAVAMFVEGQTELIFVEQLLFKMLGYQHLHVELEEQFGAEYESWVAELGKAREELTAQVLDVEARKKLLHEIASREAFITRNSPQRGEN